MTNMISKPDKSLSFNNYLQCSAATIEGTCLALTDESESPNTTRLEVNCVTKIL